MNQLLSITLGNARVATVTAIAVFGVTRVVRSPQWGHALWLLVLLKLIAPPVFYVPVLFVGAQAAANIWSDQQNGSQAALTGNASEVPASVEVSVDVARFVRRLRHCKLRAARPSWLCCLSQGGLRSPKRLVADGGDFLGRRIGGLVRCLSCESRGFICLCVRRRMRRKRGTRSWQSWLLVSVCVASLTCALRTARFPPCFGRSAAARSSCCRAGFSKCSTQQAGGALVAHELAHFRRRDHWVRWLEAVVLAVYWWHPVAWWARRGLRAAEERCCDAWAVWLLDGNARSYGETLLVTVDFLSARRPAALGRKRDGASYRSERQVRNAPARQNRSPPILARPIRNRVARPGHAPGVSLCRSSEGRAAPPSRGWARLSPFTDVNVRGDAATVQFDGQTYELVSIDDVATKAILALAKKSYGNLWEKRFVEDIVEVLERLGRRPEKTVKLLLRDPQSGALKTVDRAPLTAENRRRVYAARYRMSSSGYDLSHIVPFEVGASRLRDGDSITIVEVTGTSDRMTAGNMYVIKGTYKLASKEHATLLASVTATKRADGQGVPTQKTQSVMLDRGNGRFSLILYMGYDGNPHVSFYPAEGESFANVYFGTGDSVLKRGWWDKSK